MALLTKKKKTAKEQMINHFDGIIDDLQKRKVNLFGSPEVIWSSGAGWTLLVNDATSIIRVLKKRFSAIRYLIPKTMAHEKYVLRFTKYMRDYEEYWTRIYENNRKNRNRLPGLEGFEYADVGKRIRYRKFRKKPIRDIIRKLRLKAKKFKF